MGSVDGASTPATPVAIRLPVINELPDRLIEV